jgi:hypothetical protein
VQQGVALRIIAYRSLLGRDGLRAVRLFFFLIGAEIGKNGTAQEPVPPCQEET